MVRLRRADSSQGYFTWVTLLSAEAYIHGWNRSWILWHSLNENALNSLRRIVDGELHDSCIDE
jgi:hypothetical protein